MRKRTPVFECITIGEWNNNKATFKLHQFYEHFTEVLSKVIVFPNPMHVPTNSEFDVCLKLPRKLHWDALSFSKWRTVNFVS